LKIAAIQALRAIAAIGVVFHHATYPRLNALASGVNLFFVISGFIMVYTCWAEFGEPGAPAMFLHRRIVRIVPLYWIATTLALAILIIHGEGISLSWVIQSLLFYPFSSRLPVVDVGWTLDYEMFFYALFGVALLLPARTALLAVSAALSAICAIGLAFSVGRPNIGFPISIEFAFGMAVGYAYCRGAILDKGHAMALIALGAAIIALTGIVKLEPNTNDLRVVVWGLPALAIIVGATLSRWHWEGLSSTLAILLGDSSYAIYLFHPPVLKLLDHFLAHRIWWPMTAALSVMAGIAVHLYVERPLLNFLRQRWTWRARILDGLRLGGQNQGAVHHPEMSA
jgi:exopolysaccharide production protein ExoZ